MNNQYPDSYQFLRISSRNDDSTIIKLFAVWIGGYTGNDCWKMNSGVKSIEQCPNHLRVHGYSGSVYCIPKEARGMSSYGMSVLTDIIKRAEKADIVVEMISLDEAIREVGNDKTTYL